MAEQIKKHADLNTIPQQENPLIRSFAAISTQTKRNQPASLHKRN